MSKGLFLITRTVCTLLICSTLHVYGGVNMQNGNFFVSATDIVVPGNKNTLSITRTYNSQAGKVGWFGIGWGNYYETKLFVGIDGIMVIHEEGQGFDSKFLLESKKIDAVNAANKIIEELKRKGPVDKLVEEKLQKKFVSDPYLRQIYSEELKLSMDVKVGTVFKSINTSTPQIVKRTQEGFDRIFIDGRVEQFSIDGNLTRIKDRGDYVIDLTYELGLLKRIKDSEGKELQFAWNSDKKIIQIWTPSDPRKAKYSYEDIRLVESVDVTNDTTKYKYNLHTLLSEIIFPDKLKKEITYQYPMRFVSEIKTQNKLIEKYTYERDPKEPESRYSTTISITDANGTRQTKKYEYEKRKGSDGSLYDYRIKTIYDNNMSTEVFYSEKNNLPIKTITPFEVIEIAYTAKGLIKEKKSSLGTFSKFEYHPTFNKIISVENNYGKTIYEYNTKGQLSKTTNGQGNTFLFIYDHKEQITKMIEENTISQTKRVMSFEYNAVGAPVRFELEGVGKLDLEYDNFGQLKAIDPKTKIETVAEITKAFGTFVSMVAMITK